MEKPFRLQLQQLFWDTLENRFGKAAWAAAVLGMVFGLGFVLGSGRVSRPVKIGEGEAFFNELQQKEKKYAEIQHQVQLTYYKELLQRPKTEPIEKAEESLGKEEILPSSNPPALVDRAPSSDRMAQALARVLGSDTPKSVHEVIESSLPSRTGSPFAIQVASFPSKEGAGEMLREMRNKGFDVRLVQAEIAGKGIVYRLRIHGFKTREEAEAYRLQNHIEGITLAQ